jgi:UDP-glucuronate decarboxylase
VRILVTGGAGFVGSHLSEKLLSLGHQVTILDNFHTGSVDNIRHLQTNPNLEVIDKDVQEKFDLDVEFIFNLACPASPVHYQKDPIRTFTTSVFGAFNVLDLATRLGIPVLQASTSEVYGDPLETPQTEKYWGNVNPVGIRSCYDEGKRAAETLFFDYHRTHQTKIKIARIFNTYGPRMSVNDGRVVSNFIIQALKNEPITIYGDGKQTRSFCYVDDLVAGLISFMETSDEVHGPINFGNPTDFNMLELAQKVIELTQSKSEIAFHPLPGDDPRTRKPDISQARIQVGWQPTIELADGLIETIEYFKGKISN